MTRTTEDVMEVNNKYTHKRMSWKRIKTIDCDYLQVLQLQPTLVTPRLPHSALKYAISPTPLSPKIRHFPPPPLANCSMYLKYTNK